MSKHSLLIQRLHQKTLNGSLDWKETTNKTAFQTSFSNYTIRIRFQDDEHMPLVYISLYNQDGRLIEEFDDEAVKGQLENAYRVTKELYDLARRQALGVEKALDDILGALEEPDEQ